MPGRHVRCHDGALHFRVLWPVHVCGRQVLPGGGVDECDCLHDLPRGLVLHGRSCGCDSLFDCGVLVSCRIIFRNFKRVRGGVLRHFSGCERLSDQFLWRGVHRWHRLLLRSWF